MVNPIDPLRPASLDDLVGPAYGGYGPASSYRPYHWDMPRVETPQPTGPQFEEPPPALPRLPRYEDSLMTPELFAKLMRDLNG